jgi:hypothetical protein
MVLKSIKDAFNIRFIFDQIDPTIATIVINETDIILKTPRRGQRRTPNIRVNKLKWKCRNTSIIIIGNWWLLAH